MQRQEEVRSTHPEDAATSDTTPYLVNLEPRLVDVERTDDDHVRGCDKIPLGDRDLVDQVLADHVDVVLQLGGDRHHRGPVSDRALQKRRRTDRIENALGYWADRNKKSLPPNKDLSLAVCRRRRRHSVDPPT